MASISPISPIAVPAAPSLSPSTLGPRGGDAFSETLTRAVSAVNDLQLDARDAAVAVASGNSGVDSAQAFVAIEKANVSFQFALQIRNKLLEAYQEIMRMSV
jgi:flagellar hook-basal body complex protein FliE